MRFTLSEHSWILDALSSAEWQLIRELPEIASGRHFRPASRERLYPSPLSDDVIADENTLSQVEDWDELIRPELEESFAEARFVVEEDLKLCQTLRLKQLPDEDSYFEEMEQAGLANDSEVYRLRVPYEHTEAWYSTLNQARLLLNEEYQLADAEERFIVKALGMEGFDEERMILIAQYEIYSVVQSILVENIMSE